MHPTRSLPFVLFAMVAIFASFLRADDADEQAQDIAQMKRVWEALMSYKKENGKLPDRLGELVPKFLRNPSPARAAGIVAATTPATNAFKTS